MRALTKVNTPAYADVQYHWKLGEKQRQIKRKSAAIHVPTFSCWSAIKNSVGLPVG